MLNVIWFSFFFIAFLSALGQFLMSKTDIFSALIQSLFEAAQNGFTLSIGLTGMLCFWLGLLKIGEKSGLTNILAKALSPLFKKIMPEIPQNHPALGSIVMNMAANILGLDNAATPMGLKAMDELQELNSKKDTASNAQILFMVINASAVTLIPINILMYRQMLGCSNPSSVFIPILLATSISTLVGFLSVAYVQKLNILNRVVLTYLIGFFVFIGGVAYFYSTLDDQSRLKYSQNTADFILFLLIIIFLISGFVKRLNVYEVFIEGAKEGFHVAVQIIPYLVSMLCAIAVLRSSGVMDLVVDFIKNICSCLSLDTSFAAALPTALMKPLSGSGARAMMIETLQTYGADSFEGFISSVVQGSTETTFYVLAVYFGAVKISKTRSALPCALLSDFAGITSAIVFSYMFF